VAAKAGAAPATVALAWLRQQPGVTAPLASASRAEQLAPLIASAKLELSEVDLNLLTRASNWAEGPQERLE
jgi:aryl-alcohol dehydrogenase-like predicted oxidoreductase